MTPTHALDSSAVLAYLNKEVGWDVTAAILAKPTNACLMHALNWCEVWHISRKTQSEADVDALMAKPRAIGIAERPDMDLLFWREVAKCRHMVRSAGKTIALMDCCAIALANRCGAPVVTADHGEFDYVQASGICQVIFIRVTRSQPLSAAEFLAAT
jgi:PIN domain nuclease of toxin-antitoxin system